MIIVIVLIIIMDRQYQHLYAKRNINFVNLKNKILTKYSHLPGKYNFDQVLYIFDQQCVNRRCDRDVAKELFEQACDHQAQAQLDDIVNKYVQNLETSKLCLLRDHYRVQQLANRQAGLVDRKNTFIFLKVIQISIFSRFSETANFGYKIQPTDIPAVKLLNSYNPILNHEFVLEMEEPQFSIIFYQSGIQIYSWTFPDKPNLQEGEYERTIQSENVSFSVKLKYVPKSQMKERQLIIKEENQVTERIDRQNKALHRLCTFQPFLETTAAVQNANSNQNQSNWFHLTECVISYLPFLRLHVRALYYLLIAVILIQCLVSFFWPNQFIDVIASFYCIGILYDQTFVDYSLKLVTMQLTFCVLVVKSVWGSVQQPYFVKTSPNKHLIVLCVILKIFVILSLAITLIRKEQIVAQKKSLFYGHQDSKYEQQKIVEPPTYSIWQH